MNKIEYYFYNSIGTKLDSSICLDELIEILFQISNTSMFNKAKAQQVIRL